MALCVLPASPGGDQCLRWTGALPGRAGTRLPWPSAGLEQARPPCQDRALRVALSDLLCGPGRRWRIRPRGQPPDSCRGTSFRGSSPLPPSPPFAVPGGKGVGGVVDGNEVRRVLSSPSKPSSWARSWKTKRVQKDTGRPPSAGAVAGTVVCGSPWATQRSPTVGLEAESRVPARPAPTEHRPLPAWEVAACLGLWLPVPASASAITRPPSPWGWVLFPSPQDPVRGRGSTFLSRPHLHHLHLQRPHFK